MKKKHVEILGWVLFLCSALGFTIASLGSFWGLFGCFFFVLGCLVFLVPLIFGKD